MYLVILVKIFSYLDGHKARVWQAKGCLGAKKAELAVLGFVMRKTRLFIFWGEEGSREKLKKQERNESIQ